MLLNLYQAQYKIVDEETQEALAFYPYEIEMADGRKVVGFTNKEGMTKIVYSKQAEGTKLLTKEDEKINSSKLYFSGKPEERFIYPNYIDQSENDEDGE